MYKKGGKTISKKNEGFNIFNFPLDISKKISEKIYIWDETLRDGEQSPGVFFSKKEKAAIVERLIDAGVSIIDLGFPGVSKEEDKAIEYVLNQGFASDMGVTVRATKNDIDKALQLGVERIHAFIATSSIHMKYKLMKTPDEVKKSVEESILYAKDHGITVDFISEDTMRSDLKFVSDLFNMSVECGANVLMITDTVGCATPSSIKYITKTLIESVNHDKFGIHCHNDLGLASANTISAIEEGINYPTLTVNGIGERSGNASFAEVIMSLESIYNIDTGISLGKITQLSNLVESKSGIFLPAHAPIVGFNSFRHESGIHVDGLLKKALTYEPINPKILNRKREYVLGKHSGRNLIRSLLIEKNISFSEDHLEKILWKITSEKEKTANIKLIKSSRLKNEIQEFNESILGFSEDKFWRIVNSVIGGYNGQNFG
ncbi:MAG: homoaconitate hydratase [Promethearchaeota archaeon]|nr:MAG: homoaconitate hydratase [Candidatus Lokiarchaeota archaeon]